MRNLVLPKKFNHDLFQTDNWFYFPTYLLKRLYLLQELRDRSLFMNLFPIRQEWLSVVEFDNTAKVSLVLLKCVDDLGLRAQPHESYNQLYLMSTLLRFPWILSQKNSWCYRFIRNYSGLPIRIIWIRNS